MSTATYYFNAYSSNTWPNNPAYMVDNNTATLASCHAAAGVTQSGTAYLSTNTCAGTSLGLITKVEMRFYVSFDTGQSINRLYINVTPEFGGSSLGDVNTVLDTTSPIPWGPNWLSYTDITNNTNHPTWDTDWSDISGLDLNVYGNATSNGLQSAYLGMAKVEVRVTYTAYAASTGSITFPTGTTYRSGLAMTGTAVNAVGVNKVQYKVDAGSWVDCTGTTAWSVTVPQSSLTLGAHTIYVQVQEVGSGTWTAVDNVAIVQSPLPSQMI